MATMMVRIRVANFERWRADFEAGYELRSKHGWLGHRVVRDAADPNLVTVISKVEELQRAKAYGQSPELREAFQRSGVQGPPEVSFCDDAFERDYRAPDASRPVTLYVFPRSTSSRPVLLFCAEAGIPFEQVTVDLMAGAQHREPLSALNPSHAVPVLVDGDFVLSESSAIMKYLADRHDSPAYPREPRLRARVNERMDWVNASFLREWAHALIYPQFLPTHRRDDENVQRANLAWAKQRCEHLLGVLDHGIIGSSDYVCGSRITIADYFAAEAVWTGTVIGASFGAFPNVARWLATMRALPSWERINAGLDAAAAAMKGKAQLTIGAQA